VGDRPRRVRHARAAEAVALGDLLRDRDLLAARAERLGLSCAGVVPSRIKGPKGNQEYLAWFVSSHGPLGPA